jgi:hypothetical protein
VRSEHRQRLRLEIGRCGDTVQVDAGFLQEHHGLLPGVLVLDLLGDLPEDQVADEMAVILAGVGRTG